MHQTNKEASSNTEPEGSAWGVKMVSPTRYERFRLRKEGSYHDSANGSMIWQRIAREAGYETVPDFPIPREEAHSQRRAGLSHPLFILVLLVMGCAVAYYGLREGVAILIADAHTFVRETAETQALLADKEAECLRLLQNNARLIHEHEMIRARLERARAPQTDRAGPVRRSRPAVTTQKEPAHVSATAADSPPDIGSSTVYYIR